MYPCGQLGEQVARPLVEDRVHGIEPQPVDPVVADPHLGVLDRPFADRVGALGVVVQPFAPAGLVAVGEVGAEVGHRLRPRGAEVVVDAVEDHQQAGGVGGVDQAGEARGAAVGGERGVDVDAVVAPAALAGEGGDRHHLDRGDAELAQAGEVGDRAVEGARVAEAADVHLVDDEVLGGDARRRRRPLERRRVDHLRGAAQAAGLEARARVGTAAAVEHHVVVRAGGGVEHARVDAVALVLELKSPRAPAPLRAPSLALAGEPDRDALLRLRRPDAELDPAVAERDGAERALPGEVAGRRRGVGRGRGPGGVKRARSGSGTESSGEITPRPAPPAAARRRRAAAGSARPRTVGRASRSAPPSPCRRCRRRRRRSGASRCSAPRSSSPDRGSPTR